MSDFYSFDTYNHLRQMCETAGKKVMSSSRYDSAEVREKNRRDYVALCFASAAAENKIPKPPIKRGKNYSCGVCHKHIDENTDYCSFCGQRMKWS